MGQRRNIGSAQCPNFRFKDRLEDLKRIGTFTFRGVVILFANIDVDLEWIEHLAATDAEIVMHHAAESVFDGDSDAFLCSGKSLQRLRIERDGKCPIELAKRSPERNW